MKKSTDELMKILKNKHSIDDYFAENDSEMFFGTLQEMLEFYRLRNQLSKADVARGSGIKREYCYELLRGDNAKSPSRDKVIMLCFGLNLSVEECQQVLKKSGYPGDNTGLLHAAADRYSSQSRLPDIAALYSL